MIDYKNKLGKLILFSVSHAIWVICILLFIIGAVFVPGFFKVNNLINVLWGNVSFGFMVLGIFFVFVTGGMDLSIESTFAIAPIIGAMAMLRWFPEIVSPPAAIIIILLLGCVIGLINASLHVLLGINPFLVTLGMLIILRGLCAYIIPEGLYYLPEGFIALGNARVFDFPVAVIVFAIAVVAVFILVNKTEFGRNLYAVGSSEKAAFLFGINVGRIKTIAFLLAGFFAALGGLTAAGRMQAITADMGNGDIITVFAACFLGGMSMSGGKGDIVDLIGSILTLSMITNVLNLIGVNPFLVKVIYGLILLIAIIFANAQQQFRQKLLLDTYKSMQQERSVARAS